MRKGDKVIFRSNTPRILWGVDINFLLGNICIIKSIIELTSKTFERKAYELEEVVIIGFQQRNLFLTKD